MGYECTYGKNSDNRYWSAEAKIYKELKNPGWRIEKSFAERLVILSKDLPLFEAGLPALNKDKPSGCMIFNSDGLALNAVDGIVILFSDNMIELKDDANRSIENEILNSAPYEIYREIYHFISEYDS